MITKDDLALFSGKETECNWEARDRLLNQLVLLMQDDPEHTFAAVIRPCLDAVLCQLHSPRTQLSLSCCALLELLVGRSSTDELILPQLVRCCGSTKKLLSQETGQLLRLLVDHTQVPLRCLQLLSHEVCTEKNMAIRVRVIDAILRLLLRNHQAIMADQRAARHLEAALKRTIGDASPEVRYSAAQCFLLLESLYRGTAEGIFEEIDASAKKQLRMAIGKLEFDYSAPVQVYLSPRPVSVDRPYHGSRVVGVEVEVNVDKDRSEQRADSKDTSFHKGQHQAGGGDGDDDEVILNVQHEDIEPVLSPQQQTPTSPATVQQSPADSEFVEADDDRLPSSDTPSDTIHPVSNQSSAADDPIIPEFVSMDIDMAAFERTPVQVVVEDAENSDNRLDCPATGGRVTSSLAADTIPSRSVAVTAKSPLPAGSFSLRQRLGLTTSTPYKASMTTLRSPGSPRSSWQDSLEDLTEALATSERGTLQTFEKVAKLLSSPDKWDGPRISRLLSSLAVCIHISPDARLYSRFLVDRLQEHWAEYSGMVNASQLVGLLEHMNMDDWLWMAPGLSPQACVEVLTSEDRVTAQRLCLVKAAITCTPGVAEAVLPVLRHLLDDPNVHVRRLAMEAIGCVDRDVLAAGSSPLAPRHRHLLDLMAANK